MRSCEGKVIEVKYLLLKKDRNVELYFFRESFETMHEFQMINLMEFLIQHENPLTHILI